MRVLNLTTRIKKELMDSVDSCEIWWGKDTKESLLGSSRVQEQLKTLTLVLFDGVEHEHPDMSNMQDQNEMSALLRDVEKMVENSMFSRQTSRGDKNNHFLDQSSLDEAAVRKRIKSEFQKLMRNLQVHKPIIQLIEFDLAPQSPWKESTIRTIVLQRCYRFLSFFCFDNKINKELLL
jgi:hypothetical protein